jgi:flagellar biogenesis protein FliO
MAQAQDALYTRKWMSEEEPEEDKATSTSFAAALKAIAERNRADQSEPARQQSVTSAPKSASGLRITELEEEETEDEIEYEEDLPRVKKPSAFSRMWAWLKRKRVLGVEKQLRVTETLPLGEKRFVAILDVEGRKFLIGGGSTGVSLLTQLDGPSEGLGLVKLAASAGKRG